MTLRCVSGQPTIYKCRIHLWDTRPPTRKNTEILYQPTYLTAHQVRLARSTAHYSGANLKAATIPQAAGVTLFLSFERLRIALMPWSRGVAGDRRMRADEGA